MAVTIAMEQGLDPTAMIGGQLPNIGAAYRIGTSVDNTVIIAEADEYFNSFLNFYPTIAVILNVEADHLDFFDGIDGIIASFRKFALNTSEDGCVIVNSDDINAMRSIAGIGRRVITVGIDSGEVRARNIVFEDGVSRFDIVHPGGLIPITLRQPGKHNTYNALAATASAFSV